MVTFRFYVVSIVAFFLALAVGVVLGSVLDERIADSLQDRLDGVEASLDETVAAIDDKNEEIERLERYIEASAPFAVQGRLSGTAGLVVAETGVDGAAVEDQVDRRAPSYTAADGDALDDLGVLGPLLDAVAVDLGGPRPGLAGLEDDAVAERDAQQVGQRRRGVGVAGDHEVGGHGASVPGAAALAHAGATTSRPSPAAAADIRPS